jgi:hypothetical protein
MKRCLQLMAPPRDARRIAREARKAAPETAGRCGQPSKVLFGPFQNAGTTVRPSGEGWSLATWLLPGMWVCIRLCIGSTHMNAD